MSKSNVLNENLLLYIAEGDDDKGVYKNKMKDLNILLTINGFPEVGDLFDNSFFSINKTISVIQQVLEDRQKLMESKSDLMKKTNKSDIDYLNLIDKSESNKEKINELINKNNSFRNKIANDEKKFKEEMERMKNEKFEMEKSINRMAMKENQFKHEIKKNEKEIEELKNRLKKVMNENMNKSSNSSNINSNSPLTKSSNNFTLNEFISPSIKLSNTINSVLNDNTAKNSPQLLLNVNHFKEFYNLIYQALNCKVNYILNENSELRACFKIILNEINDYIEFKKLILYKFSQDSFESIKDNFKNFQNILNLNVFELDFNESKEMILNGFNDILNEFRFILIYDILKVEPTNEFEFDDLKKIVLNKKYEFEDVPYYKSIKTILESFDFQKLNSVKNLIAKNSMSTTATSQFKKKSIKKDEVFIDIAINEKKQSEIKSLETLEDINKDLLESINLFEERFSKLENEFSNLSDKK